MYKLTEKWYEIWEKKARKEFGNIPSVVSGFDDGNGKFNSEVLDTMIAEILEKIDLRKGHKLLEVGCGAGMLLEVISKRCQYVVGVDFSFAMLKSAKKFIPNALFLQSEACDLPAIRTDSFDRVLVNSVWQYFPDYSYAERSLMELLRVCKPNGRIVILDIPDINQKEMCELNRKREDKKECPGHLYFDKEFFRKNLEKYVYMIVEQSGLTTSNSRFRFNVIVDKKINTDLRYKKDFSKIFENVKESGTLPLPDSWDFVPTLRCNLNCFHCYQDHNREVEDEMSVDQIKKVFQSLDVEGRIVKLIGGEVFARKDIFEILDYLKERKTQIILATNGLTVSDEILNRLDHYPIFEMTCSIDGTEDIHNIMRNNPKSFQKATRFIEYSGLKYKVNVTCLVRYLNYKILTQVLELKKLLPINALRFQFEICATRGDLNESQQVLGYDREAFDVFEVAERSLSIPPVEFMEIYKEMKAKDISFFTQPDYFDQYPDAVFERNIRDKFHVYCIYLFRGRINPNGDIIACPFILKSFGTLLRESINDIWNNPDYISFRKNLANNNLLPICENCCNIRISRRKGN